VRRRDRLRPEGVNDAREVSKMGQTPTLTG
jgi:hypothetical protein